MEVREMQPCYLMVAEKDNVYNDYKDRVFRLLFRENKRLLELYNALNNSQYENESDLIVNTLENAMFIKMKNDVSFIIESDMCLYEHQSTYCPNMPLRGLLYFADLYKKLTKNIELSVRRKIWIPTPQYVVFYNGKEKREAVERAVDECIQNDILKDFFMEQKAEVVAMSIYEYNEEYARKVTYEDGESAGYARGKSEGENIFAVLTEKLIENSCMEDLIKATRDKEYRNSLYEKYGIRRL